MPVLPQKGVDEGKRRPSPGPPRCQRRGGGEHAVALLIDCYAALWDLVVALAERPAIGMGMPSL